MLQRCVSDGSTKQTSGGGRGVAKALVVRRGIEKTGGGRCCYQSVAVFEVVLREFWGKMAIYGNTLLSPTIYTLILVIFAHF